MSGIVFDPPLTEAVIVGRRSMYTMDVDIGGETVVCHCPTRGRVGNIDLSERPCLLSPSTDPRRRTPYTVEAVSLDEPGTDDKSWVGINQNAANRYVEHYLCNGGLADMVRSDGPVRREVAVGDSKLDFAVGDTYIEVKTPLQVIQADIPPHVRTLPSRPFSSTDRMVRHLRELADNLDGNGRAVMLLVFIYDNPGFRVVEPSTNHGEVSAAVAECVSRGVEIWQANLRMHPGGVVMTDHRMIGTPS
ncbi:MAG: DNA/RNA nuclease SfsA [Candidatus Methanomethylophilaceae archaeon]|nr:DNA/RNA nuclease SfsA [Candidatus Methanomethylophilaceae archaeon]